MKLPCCLMLMMLVFTVAADGAPAPAQTNDNNDTLVMGVFPRRNAATTILYFKPIADYLSQKLNRKVRLETAKNFPTFWNGVKQKKYDLVHFNQYHYIQSRKEFGYRVILKNEEFHEKTLAGVIVVRKDSGINTLNDLRGKKILFGGGPGAMVAYIATTQLLRTAGLRKGDYEEVFAKNPPNACIGTFLRQADAGGLGDIVLKMPTILNRLDVNQLKVIATSKQLPQLPWAVKGNLPPALAEKIQQLLVSLHESAEGRRILSAAKLSNITIATDDEYSSIRLIVKEITGDQY